MKSAQISLQKAVKLSPMKTDPLPHFYGVID